MSKTLLCSLNKLSPYWSHIDNRYTMGETNWCRFGVAASIMLWQHSWVVCVFCCVFFFLFCFLETNFRQRRRKFHLRYTCACWTSRETWNNYRWTVVGIPTTYKKHILKSNSIILKHGAQCTGSLCWQAAKDEECCETEIRQWPRAVILQQQQCPMLLDIFWYSCACCNHTENKNNVKFLKVQ